MRCSYKQGSPKIRDFFPDQGGQNYEFNPTGITSIGGSELDI
jgi:hypothetical protein